LRPATEEDQDPNKGALVFLSVRDTGCGISEVDAKKLFKEFTTLKSSASLNPNGVGLGLSICKKICNLLKGDINLKSEINKGSIFTFYVTADLNCKDSEYEYSQ
jgi:signal transduction histidine kinase